VGRRGVEVTLILPSQTDSWLVFHAGRNYYEQLLRAGVKIHERRVLAVTGRSATEPTAATRAVSVDP
jgi:cardiolipin synthase